MGRTSSNLPTKKELDRWKLKRARKAEERRRKRSGVVSTTSVDSTHVKAHRSAAGAKGGASNKPSAGLAADGRPKFIP